MKVTKKVCAALTQTHLLQKQISKSSWSAKPAFRLTQINKIKKKNFFFPFLESTPTQKHFIKTPHKALNNDGLWEKAGYFSQFSGLRGK